MSHVSHESNQAMSEATFAGRIKKVRKAMKITQKELAARMDMSGAALSEIEKGKYKPGHNFFYHIAKEFQVNLYYLFFGEGEMFMDPSQAFDMGVESLPSSNEDVKRFLWYFQRSPILQYHILAHFRSILKKEEGLIEDEAKDYEEKIKNYR